MPTIDSLNNSKITPNNFNSNYEHKPAGLSFAGHSGAGAKPLPQRRHSYAEGKLPTSKQRFGGFLKKGYPKMDGLWWKILFKWMIWGVPPCQETLIQAGKCPEAPTLTPQ